MRRRWRVRMMIPSLGGIVVTSSGSGSGVVVNSRYWPKSMYVKAFAVLCMVAPFAFLQWLDWHRAFMPMAVILLGWAGRVVGLKAGWLVPTQSDSRVVRPRSRPATALLVSVMVLLAITAAAALVWVTLV